MGAITIDFLLSSIMLTEYIVLNFSLCMDNLFHISNYLSGVPDFPYARRGFGLVMVFSSFLCLLFLLSLSDMYLRGLRTFG